MDEFILFNHKCFFINLNSKRAFRLNEFFNAKFIINHIIWFNARFVHIRYILVFFGLLIQNFSNIACVNMWQAQPTDNNICQG